MKVKEIAEYLVYIGAINWGLTILGINLVDIVAELLGLPIVGTIVYGAVGVSGAYLLAKKLKLM
jgi:uncharacterized membrane protein YuzA (DUF378 family)